MKSLIDIALSGLGLSDEDLQLGFKDVGVQLTDGTSQTLRVSRIAADLQAKLLEQYARSNDPRVLLRPMLATEFAADAFLNRVQPHSLAMLSNTAILLMFGTGNLHKLFVRAGVERWAQ